MSPLRRAEARAKKEREKARERLRKRKEKQRQQEAQQRREWATTDHGRAKLAHDAGEMFFQIQRVVSKTRGALMIGALTQEVKGPSGFDRLFNKLVGARNDLPITQTLAVVEHLGWRLMDVGYVYRQTAAESRDYLLRSGQDVAMSGELVAIYLFRRIGSENNR